LVPTGFAPYDPAAEPSEGGGEEGFQRVRLEVPGAALAQPVAEAVHLHRGENVAVQGPLLDEPVQSLPDGGVDLGVEARTDLRVVPVPHRLDQQVAERVVLERPPEDVEDLALVRPGLLLQLGQQPEVDLALPGVPRHALPEVAHLGLADPVEAAQTLLDAVGVPREVVVDHEMRPLEVQPLPGGVGGDQDADGLVVGEQLPRPPPRLTWEATVDPDDRAGVPHHLPDALSEVVERVTVLREDDDLAKVPVGVPEQVVLPQEPAQLGPLAVGSAGADPAGELDEIPEDRDLLVELRDRLGGGGGVDHLVLEPLLLLS